MMIPERYMVTGICLDNANPFGFRKGERITGYYDEDDFGIYIRVLDEVEGYSVNIDVDPKTIAFVAVKPTREVDKYEERFRCPNCGVLLSYRSLIREKKSCSLCDDYCYECGQKLDWKG